MKLNLKLHNPTDSTLEFLELIAYPHRWTGTMLRRDAFVIWIHNEARETVGYVWFTIVPDTYRVFEFHIAIHPKYHIRWLSKEIYYQLLDIAKFLDARVILMYLEGNEQYLKVLKRLGWTTIHKFALLEV